ncbi:hypothetical protein KDN24_13685 [Bacillus sp. Bva_UNVM-123]|uniref:hypothetical protein n=1 Tax=Bacillus sp. Bva_UNVM-123 TaxID=2829798 RepID=UPI00391F21C0
MDYLYLILGAIIVISCFYFIIAPFFNSGGKALAYADGNDGELPLEMIYEAVNELEMDYLMKKISKDDFESMKKRYQALAAGYLTHDNQVKANHPRKETIDDETEREILKELSKLRKQKGRVE